VRKGKKTLAILAGLSIFSLLVGAFVLINQVGRKNGWQKTDGINKLYVVNRSSHGFEVVWSTNSPPKEDQWVEVGTEKGAYFNTMSRMETVGGVYHATITGLKADTNYFFRIRKGIKTYILPSLVSDAIHTPKDVKEKPVSPAYGKVVLPSKRPYTNGLLIYEIDGFYPLAVFTKETGEWLLPLTGLIEKKNNTITSISDTAHVSIRLFSYPEGVTRTIVGQTRPLKQSMIAGVSIQLAQETQGNGLVLGTTTQTSLPKLNEQSSIIYPKENALIPGNTPLIRGTAPAGKLITVLIQASTKQYSYRTKSDEKGDWLVQYPLVLEPGRYTIIATIENSARAPTLVRRGFSIIKSGEQVLGVATGTPTLIPTSPLVPTISPTSIPTSMPITVPTTIQYPTTVLPTRFIPTATPPVTGGGISGYLFGALFCIVVGAGLVLAF
jgi:hypothetical protein